MCSNRRTFPTTLTALALLALTAAAPIARAAVFTVSKTADTADGACDTDCSLREAILAANNGTGNDFILLGPGVYTLTRAGADEDAGATGDLDIRGDIAIIGASAASTILDGAQLDRVLDVAPGATVEIRDVTFRGGRVAGPGGGIHNAGLLTLSRCVITNNATAGPTGYGGGIETEAGGSLTLEQSTLAGNTAAAGGGGLAAHGAAQVTSSTVSGNHSGSDFGGGIYVFASNDVRFADATITGNSAGKFGGGIYAEGSPFIGLNNPQLKNTILAGNTASTQRDCSGPVRSVGFNLLGDGFDCIDFTAAHHDLVGTTAAPLDPRLGPLVNNGGSTPTQALLAGSPAVDHGGDCAASDQRGQTRPAGAACDIGAFEAGTDCLNGGPTLCLSQERFEISVQWRTAQASGSGQGVRLTDDSGYFWFFDPANIEVTGKVLNGCGVNNRYWVFLSGLTNVAATITVTDTRSGRIKTYQNPANTTFVTRLDTNAFATCP